MSVERKDKPEEFYRQQRRNVRATLALFALRSPLGPIFLSDSTIRELSEALDLPNEKRKKEEA